MESAHVDSCVETYILLIDFIASLFSMSVSKGSSSDVPGAVPYQETLIQQIDYSARSTVYTRLLRSSREFWN